MRLAQVVLCLGSAATATLAQDPATAPLRIRVRVLDAAGQPLHDAVARVGSLTDLTTAETLAHPQARSGADGQIDFTWSGSDATGRGSVLLITAPRKATLRCPDPATFAMWRGEKDAVFGDVRLCDGVKLSGRVRGRDGKPIPGARITATDCLSSYPWLSPAFGSQAVTAADGTFLLDGVFRSAMALEVIADGYYRMNRACLGVGDPLDLQLTASGFVEGKVVDEQGRPARTRVELQYEGMTAAHYAWRASEGDFRLPVLEPGRLRVYARVGWECVAESPVQTGPATGLVLRVGDRSKAEHLVRAESSADGSPVPAIRVSAQWGDRDLDDTRDDMLEWGLRYAPSGSKVALPHHETDAKQGLVRVVADGYAPWTERAEWQPGEVLVAKLLPEARITGHVVDASSGKPVAGAKVTCIRARKSEQSFGMRLPPVPVTTGADGSFAIGGLAGGVLYRLVAAHETGSASVERTVKLEAGAVRKEELALPAGASLAGRLTGVAPGPGWRVQLESPGQARPEWASASRQGDLESWNCEDSVPVAADGSFRFAHRAARSEQVLVVVPLPPRQGAALRIPVTTLRVGTENEELQIDATRSAPGAIAGKVHFAGAEFPACRLAVIAVPVASGGDRSHYEEVRVRHWALVSPDGTFTIPVGAGTYRLQTVDVATGVVLLKADDELAVAAGRTTEGDLTVRIAEAIVTLAGDAQGRQSSSLLKIVIGQDIGGGFVPGETWLFCGQLGSPYLDIRGCDEVHCFLPPGQVKLLVEVGAATMSRGSASWSSTQPRAEKTVDCEAGKPCRVTLELPAPAELGGG